MALPYYQQPINDILTDLKTNNTGLSNEQAKARLEKYGLNKLEAKKDKTVLNLIVSQFKSFLIWILIAAAVIAFALGELIDFYVIFAIIIINAILGFAQEYKAERAVEALRKLSAQRARVIRSGKQVSIPAEQLVPGDIICVGIGDKLPADARLIEAFNLRVDESSLTGESTPVEKNIVLIKTKSIVAEQKNTIFSNTIITNGRATAVVVQTGQHTQIGQVAELIQTAEEKETPLQIKLESVAKLIAAAILIISILVFAVNYFAGVEVFESLLVAIALAVAAVPEGLPAVITITLALGMSRLAKKNSIMRTLPAVETLGATTFICTDKTGTLTENKMTIRKLYFNGRVVDITGVGYEPTGDFRNSSGKIDIGKNHEGQLLLQIGALCNSASLVKNKHWEITGDPTEGALIVSAAKAGMIQEELRKHFPQTGEISFDPTRKLMTTIHKDDKLYAFTKGAPDILVNSSDFVLIDGEERPMTVQQKQKILAAAEHMAMDALRVLGMAYRVLPSSLKEYTSEDVEKKLVFVGLQGMIDPPRKEVKAALYQTNSAGIGVAMVTGDHKLTAFAIAKELGLVDNNSLILEGRQLDKMSDSELEEKVDVIKVYARVTPEHKIRIVRALQKKGHVVAMTGDGVNDAPALKQAEIGIAMGLSGTDVAKEAADMILADDNFATIVKAIKEGRGVYDNIKKFLRFLLSSNVGEVFTIFGAAIIGFPLPLLAVQILWMNLLTDGLPAVALALDPADKDVMLRKPRAPDEKAIDNNMLKMILMVGFIMTAGTLILFNFERLATDLKTAQTVAFTTLVMFEMFNVFNTRSHEDSAFSDLFSNKWLWVAVISSISLQFAVVYLPPLQVAFGTVALSIMQWGLILGVSSSVFVFVELGKYLGRMHQHT